MLYPYPVKDEPNCKNMRVTSVFCLLWFLCNISTVLSAAVNSLFDCFPIGVIHKMYHICPSHQIYWLPKARLEFSTPRLTSKLESLQKCFTACEEDADCFGFDRKEDEDMCAFAYEGVMRLEVSLNPVHTAYFMVCCGKQIIMRFDQRVRTTIEDS
ncbi:hypothetical protein CRM22_001792 [Opisthorchis felineus]|uniref:Apple domain-containing protein n=1 Tax=Opisthorchis felineus TaxID=147828 RepID=A0A4S2MFB1_OPIFE|nr:hypothetical protein CRM22_001792 [Opisthorchis felineus]